MPKITQHMQWLANVAYMKLQQFGCLIWVIKDPLLTWKEQGILELHLGLGAALTTAAADLDEWLGSMLTRFSD